MLLGKQTTHGLVRVSDYWVLKLDSISMIPNIGIVKTISGTATMNKEIYKLFEFYFIYLTSAKHV